MKRKAIKIDWDALDDAFNNQNDELVYYLDLVTGHVVLEGEGEEDTFDDEDDYSGGTLHAAASTQNDATRLYIWPPDTACKVDWMKVFVDSETTIDAAVAQRLRDALQLDEPAGEIVEILREHPEERERWFRYRTERVREMIDRWLEEHAVEVTDRPPWRAA